MIFEKCYFFNQNEALKFLHQNRQKSCIFQKSVIDFQMPVKHFLEVWRGHYKFWKCSRAWKLSNARRILVIRCVEMNLRPLAWPVSNFPKKFGQIGWKIVQKTAILTDFWYEFDFNQRKNFLEVQPTWNKFLKGPPSRGLSNDMIYTYSRPTKIVLSQFVWPPPLTSRLGAPSLNFKMYF